MATFKQFKAQDIIISPLEVNKGFRIFAPSPTPSVTTSISSTPSPSITPSISVSPTPSISKTPSITPSITVSKSISRTPTRTPSKSMSITPSKSISVTPSRTAGISQTPSRSVSITPSTTPTITATPSVSITPSKSISVTPSKTPSTTPSQTVPSSLYEYTYYGFSNANANDACVDQGTKTAIYTDNLWDGQAPYPILYFNSGGTKRMPIGYYSNGSASGYFGATGTWNPSQLCLN